MSYKPPYKLEAGIFVRDRVGNSIEILSIESEPDNSGKNVIAIVNETYIKWYYESGAFSDEPSNFDILLADKEENSDSYFKKIKKKRKYLI